MPGWGYDEVNTFSHGFIGGMSEQTLRSRIPAGDGAIKRLRDNGVV
jgi:hypothetical protein